MEEELSAQHCTCGQTCRHMVAADACSCVHPCLPPRFPTIHLFCMWVLSGRLGGLSGVPPSRRLPLATNHLVASLQGAPLALPTRRPSSPCCPMSRRHRILWLWLPDHHDVDCEARAIQTCANNSVTELAARQFWEETRLWHNRQLCAAKPNAWGPIDISDRTAFDWCGWLHTCFKDQLTALVGPGITSAVMAFNKDIPDHPNLMDRLELVLVRLDGSRVKLHPGEQPITESPDIAAAFPLCERCRPQDICWTAQLLLNLAPAYAEEFGLAREFLQDKRRELPQLPNDKVARAFFSDITEGLDFQWWRWLKSAQMQGPPIRGCNGCNPFGVRRFAVLQMNGAWMEGLGMQATAEGLAGFACLFENSAAEPCQMWKVMLLIPGIDITDKQEWRLRQPPDVSAARIKFRFEHPQTELGPEKSFDYIWYHTELWQKGWNHHARMPRGSAQQEQAQAKKASATKPTGNVAPTTTTTEPGPNPARPAHVAGSTVLPQPAAPSSVATAQSVKPGAQPTPQVLSLATALSLAPASTVISEASVGGRVTGIHGLSSSSMACTAVLTPTAVLPAAVQGAQQPDSSGGRANKQASSNKQPQPRQPSPGRRAAAAAEPPPLPPPPPTHSASLLEGAVAQ